MSIDLLNLALSVTKVNGMTVTVYPQLILIERGNNWKQYIGWSKKDSIRLFRKEFPLRKHKK